MKKDRAKNSNEDLKRKYLSLIKKIPTEDLQDMLVILYTDDKLLASEDHAFGKLDEKEKEYYARQRARLFFDDKREKLRLILDKKFDVFNEEKIPDPLLSRAPQSLKEAIKESGISDLFALIYPKIPFLIEVIKSVLILRDAGKDLSDDQTISTIECFTSDHSEKDYKIVINGDYMHPIEVRRSKKIWNMFLELIEEGYLERNEATLKLYDYLNYNKNNLISSNTQYPPQKIIKQNNNSYEPLFRRAIYSEKTLVQRQNKLKGLLKNT